MDEYGITITDPNYRDPTIISAYERAERELATQKLAVAAAREERWLNEPFFYERAIEKIKQIHNHLFSKQKVIKIPPIGGIL